MLLATQAYTAELENLQNELLFDEPSDSTVASLPKEINQNSIDFLYSNEKCQVVFNAESGIAAFKRGRSLWFIFDEIIDFEINTPSISFIQNCFTPNVARDYTQTQLTAIEFRKFNNENIEDGLLFNNDGTRWVIEFNSNSPKEDAIVISRPRAQPTPHVLINATQTSKPFKFTDPNIGDSIYVFTTNKSNLLVSRDYNFIDFQVLQTLQGVAVKPNADTVSAIRTKDDNIKISSSGGLNIAKKVFQKSQQKKQAYDVIEFDYESILPLKKLESKGKAFLKTEKQLRRDLFKSATPDIAALKLVMFYLANNMSLEARALLNDAIERHPNLGHKYYVKLLQTVIEYLHEDYMSALKTINSIALQDVPIKFSDEVQSWKSIVLFAALEGKPTQREDEIAALLEKRDTSFFINYPLFLQHEIAINIVNYKISVGEKVDAYSILQTIYNDPIDSNKIKNRILHATGRYFLAAGAKERAMQFLDLCIMDLADIKNRTLCEFEKIQYQVQNDLLDPEELFEKLELLLLLWRGDAIELDIMAYAAERYFEHGKYKKAMRKWQQIIAMHPNNPISIKYTNILSETFLDTFLHHDITIENAFDALVFFYEFQSFLPIGPTGDQVVLKFVDNLIALDLLDQAGNILEHQVTNRLKGFDRERALNKLMEVYLDNNKLENIVKAVELGTKYNKLPDSLGLPRKYLYAKALILQEKYEEALEVLDGDYSFEADMTRVSMFWKLEDWHNFNQNSEPFIYRNRDEMDMLDEAQTIIILRQVFSYMYQNNKELIRELYEDYKDRITQDNMYGKIFHYVGETILPKLDNNKIDYSKLAQLVRDIASDS